MCSTSAILKSFHPSKREIWAPTTLWTEHFNLYLWNEEFLMDHLLTYKRKKFRLGPLTHACGSLLLSRLQTIWETSVRWEKHVR